MKKALKLSLIVVGLSLIITLMYPSPIDSAAWNPPPAPALTDSPQTTANTRLTTAELLAEGEIYGPEDRLPDLDKMHPLPWLKNLSAKLPDAFKPKPIDYGLVLGLDENGTIVTSLHDPEGLRLKEITSVEEHKGYLYLGSLHNDRIGKLKLAN